VIVAFTSSIGARIAIPPTSELSAHDDLQRFVLKALTTVGVDKVSVRYRLQPLDRPAKEGRDLNALYWEGNGTHTGRTQAIEAVFEGRPARAGSISVGTLVWLAHDPRIELTVTGSVGPAVEVLAKELYLLLSTSSSARHGYIDRLTLAHTQAMSAKAKDGTIVVEATSESWWSRTWRDHTSAFIITVTGGLIAAVAAVFVLTWLGVAS
jgi:hypothetical protein